MTGPEWKRPRVTGGVAGLLDRTIFTPPHTVAPGAHGAARGAVRP